MNTSCKSKASTSSSVFYALREKAAQGKMKRLAVAGANAPEVLEALYSAHDNHIVEPVLVGPIEAIKTMCQEKNLDWQRFEIVDADTQQDAAMKAVLLVSSGKADLLMKGHMETSTIMKAVLAKENNFRGPSLISHVSLIHLISKDRLFIITDGAINIAPSLEDKVILIKHAVLVAHAIGIANPKVAVLSPTETVNEKIPSTMDAVALVAMNQGGEIEACIVGGPYALDNAVSAEAAHHKGIGGPVAGCADILLVPDLMSGNVLIKSMEYFADTEKAGVLLGAKAPIVLTSRASSVLAKMNSIAVGVLIAKEKI